VQENADKQTQYKSDKVNNLKYSKTKLAWFSCLLQHSARKTRWAYSTTPPSPHVGQLPRASTTTGASTKTVKIITSGNAKILFETDNLE